MSRSEKPHGPAEQERVQQERLHVPTGAQQDVLDEHLPDTRILEDALVAGRHEAREEVHGLSGDRLERRHEPRQYEAERPAHEGHRG